MNHLERAVRWMYIWERLINNFHLSSDKKLKAKSRFIKAKLRVYRLAYGTNIKN